MRRRARQRNNVITMIERGSGIPASSVTSASVGVRLGLLGMRERVNLVGGSLEVQAITPHGTRVRATILGEQPLT